MAVIVAVPLATAVTSPEALTVDDDDDEDDQVKEVPEMVVPFAVLALALSWAVSPM